MVDDREPCHREPSQTAQLTGSEQVSASRALSVEAWVRPLVLGTTGYILSKQGAFAFPRLNGDGSLDAQLTLSSGAQTLHVSSAARYNIWSHLVMTYDGAAIKVYVNGQLKAQAAASGTIVGTANPVLLGSGFKGVLDEINVHPRALSAQEALDRYQSAPNMPPNQPLAPAPILAGQVSGQISTQYGFRFAAWDLDGDPVKYRIDWGTGTKSNGVRHERLRDLSTEE